MTKKVSKKNKQVKKSTRKSKKESADQSSYNKLTKEELLKQVNKLVTKCSQLETKYSESIQDKGQGYYHRIFNLVADGIMVVEGKTKQCLDANQAFCSMLGYDYNEVLSIDISQIHPADRLEHIIEEFEAQSKGLKTLASDIPCVRKNGELIYADINTVPVVIDGKKCLVGIFRDVTERRTIERRVKASEELYRSFVESYHGIAYRARVGGAPIFFHGSVKEVTGFSEHEFLTGKVSWANIIYAEDWEKINQSWVRIASVPAYSNEREYRIVRKDGTISWVRDAVHNVSDEKGQIIYVQGTITDITEIKKRQNKD